MGKQGLERLLFVNISLTDGQKESFIVSLRILFIFHYESGKMEV